MISLLGPSIAFSSAHILPGFTVPDALDRAALTVSRQWTRAPELAGEDVHAGPHVESVSIQPTATSPDDSANAGEPATTEQAPLDIHACLADELNDVLLFAALLQARFSVGSPTLVARRDAQVVSVLQYTATLPHFMVTSAFYIDKDAVVALLRRVQELARNDGARSLILPTNEREADVFLQCGATPLIGAEPFVQIDLTSHDQPSQEAQ